MKTYWLIFENSACTSNKRPVSVNIFSLLSIHQPIEIFWYMKNVSNTRITVHVHPWNCVVGQLSLQGTILVYFNTPNRKFISSTQVPHTGCKFAGLALFLPIGCTNLQDFLSRKISQILLCMLIDNILFKSNVSILCYLNYIQCKLK